MEQKYYKLINQNNIVVDVVDKLKYLRYISDLDKLVTTDKGTSDGIIGSDKKTVYLWVGKKCPPNKPWQHVEVVEIAKTDYNLLKQRLSNNEKIVENTQTLITARKNKINELSTICNETIIKGVNILLTDGLYHSFKMTNEDQINLLQIENEILKNNDEQLFLYHETNQQCKLFSKDDMLIIITQVNKHRQWHTTYFNFAKNCINNLQTIDKIIEFKYGMLDSLTTNQVEILRSLT